VVPTIDNLLDAQGSLLAANASLDTAAGIYIVTTA
jgi:hypothetical protein